MKQNKVLVIDHEVKFQRNVTTFLAMYNYKVITAFNGDDGVKKANDEEPDLILVDEMVPCVDKTVVLGELKNNKRISKVPLIMITDKECGKNTDKVTNYIVKPFRLVDLEKKIRNILDS